MEKTPIEYDVKMSTWKDVSTILLIPENIVIAIKYIYKMPLDT